MSTILRIGLCLAVLSMVMASSKIEPALSQALAGGKTARLLVSMVDRTDEIQKSFENREFASHAERATAFNQELTALATKSQADVVRVLEAAKNRIPVTWESLWITNQIVVNGADLNLANAIAAVANVAKLESEQFVELH